MSRVVFCPELPGGRHEQSQRVCAPGPGMHPVCRSSLGLRPGTGSGDESGAAELSSLRCLCFLSEMGVTPRLQPHVFLVTFSSYLEKNN